MPKLSSSSAKKGGVKEGLSQQELDTLAMIRKSNEEAYEFVQKGHQLLPEDEFLDIDGARHTWKSVWEANEPRDKAHKANDPNMPKSFTKEEWEQKSPDSEADLDHLIYIIPILLIIVLYGYFIASAIFFPKPIKRKIRKFRPRRKKQEEKGQDKIIQINVLEEEPEIQYDYSSSSEDDDELIKSGIVKITATTSRKGKGSKQKSATFRKKVGATEDTT